MTEKNESVFRFRFFWATEKPTLKSRFSVGKKREKPTEKNDFRFSVHNPGYITFDITFDIRYSSPGLALCCHAIRQSVVNPRGRAAGRIVDRRTGLVSLFCFFGPNLPALCQFVML